MTQVLIKCPSCQKKGFIDISSKAMKNMSRGVIAINIPEHKICNHSFIVYVDKNLSVRDYFITDYRFKLPDLTQNKIIEKDKTTDKINFDIDLIKLNLNANLMAHILKSILSKKKIAIVSNQLFIYEHLLNFFNNLNQNAFDVDITIISKEKFNHDKKKYKDYVVLEGSKVVNDKDKIMQPKKIKLEKQIVQNFLSESDLVISFMMLRNEIQKIYTLSKTIADYTNEYKEKDKLSINMIADHIKKLYNIQIQKTFLSTLIDIVKDYFGITVIKIDTFQDVFEYF